jgi:hypothetical protein
MLDAALVDRNARLGVVARVGGQNQNQIKGNYNPLLISKDLASIHEFLMKNYVDEVEEEKKKRRRSIFSSISQFKVNHGKKSIKKSDCNDHVETTNKTDIVDSKLRPTTRYNCHFKKKRLKILPVISREHFCKTRTN